MIIIIIIIYLFIYLLINVQSLKRQPSMGFISSPFSRCTRNPNNSSTNDIREMPFFFFPDNKLLRFTTKINYASKPGSLSSKSFCSLCISAPSNTKSCKKPTPPPNANLRLASQALREWFSNGERVYYQCNPGYSQTGFSIQRCSKGQWMPAKSLLTCIG